MTARDPLQVRWATVHAIIHLLRTSYEFVKVDQHAAGGGPGRDGDGALGQIVTVCQQGARSYDADERLFDLGCVLIPGDGVATRDLSRQVACIEVGHEHGRALSVLGADGHTYVIVVNFGHAEAQLTVPSACPVTDVITGEALPDTDGHVPVVVPPTTMRVLR